MKQVRAKPVNDINWQEEMNKTITVEMTIGELINITMRSEIKVYNKAMQQLRETFDADEMFYNTVPSCENLYKECIDIVLNNLPLQLKKEREISYELD